VRRRIERVLPSAIDDHDDRGPRRRHLRVPRPKRRRGRSVADRDLSLNDLYARLVGEHALRARPGHGQRLLRRHERHDGHHPLRHQGRRDPSDHRQRADSPASLAVASTRVLWTTPISIEAYPITWSGGNAYPLENWGGQGGVISDGTSFFAEGEDPIVGVTVSMFPNDLLFSNGSFEATTIGPVSQLGGLAVDASYIYYARWPSSPAIARRAKTHDATEEVLTSDVPSAVLSTMLAVDDACAYYLDTSSGDVRGVPTGGGASVAIARGLPAPTSIAVDADDAWITTQGGDILAIARRTGEVTRRAAGGAAQAILVDATSFYWIASSPAGGGTVKRGAK
jgi:hypothetical protein